MERTWQLALDDTNSVPEPPLVEEVLAEVGQPGCVPPNTRLILENEKVRLLETEPDEVLFRQELAKAAHAAIKAFVGEPLTNDCIIKMTDALNGVIKSRAEDGMPKMHARWLGDGFLISAQKKARK